MSEELSKLKVIQNQAEEAAHNTNIKINELGQYTGELHEYLTEIQLLFDIIRNVPSEMRLGYTKLKEIRINWKQQVDKIEREYNNAETKSVSHAAVGVSTGVAVVALGPTAAMGIATTFGVASTGTAISTLSGAAATNAALAWLGGGALAAGGGGMAAGSAFLGLAGPIGWTIAGVSILAGGLLYFKSKSDRERLENVFILISKRDIKTYELAYVELCERIKRIIDESQKLRFAISRIKTFGTDYNNMSEAQQYEIGAYFNLMEASTALMVNPVLGLQPKYNEIDFEKHCAAQKQKTLQKYLVKHKNMVISLANLLYKITLEDEDVKLLAESLADNNSFLESVNMSKEEFDSETIYIVERALYFRYKQRP